MADPRDDDTRGDPRFSLLQSADYNVRVSRHNQELNLESISSFRKSSFRRMITGCVSSSESSIYSRNQVYDHSPAADLSSLKSRASSFRRFFTPQRLNSEKSSSKTSFLKRIIRWGGRRSTTAVHPDQKLKPSNEQSAFVSKHSRDQGPWWTLSFHYEDNNLPKELGSIEENCHCACRFFSYQELVSATSNFSPENMVGKGGSSHVYKGRLSNRQQVAVKILKPSLHALKEFAHEVDIVESLRHKNVIHLVGYCSAGKNLSLVYEFLPWGSLDGHLHGGKNNSVAFGWLERYKVAIGVAEALDYLHNCHEPPIIHRDVKSSNILLSENFEPKLSDFGLATFDSSPSLELENTDVTGTFGYLAPEYIMHGQISDKVDVYAFGVVLLELLSGRKAISSASPDRRESLVAWAKPILDSGKLSRLLDPSMDYLCDSGVIARMITAAKLCIRRSPKIRPDINLVLKVLSGAVDVTPLAKQQVGENAIVQSSDSEEESIRRNMDAHVSVALLDLEGDSEYEDGEEENVSVEKYLKYRS